MTGMHRCFLFTIMLMLSVFFSMNAGVPDKPTQIKFMWDYANVIDDEQEKLIEESLVDFSQTTSNQIVVMTVTDQMLDGLEMAEFGQQLGEDWGVGQKDLNNGVVIVIKPKTDSSEGEAHITTGYGVEGPLPDLLCSNVVNEEMIPHFKRKDYASGVWAALTIIMPALQGEFNIEDLIMSSENDTSSDDNTSSDKKLFYIIIILVIIIFISIKIISLLRRYKYWFGTYIPDSPECSTEIPFDGDLQKCFGYLKQ